jgi:hypothetical protein
VVYIPTPRAETTLLRFQESKPASNAKLNAQVSTILHCEVPTTSQNWKLLY